MQWNQQIYRSFTTDSVYNIVHYRGVTAVFNWSKWPTRRIWCVWLVCGGRYTDNTSISRVFCSLLPTSPWLVKSRLHNVRLRNSNRSVYKELGLHCHRHQSQIMLGWMSQLKAVWSFRDGILRTLSRSNIFLLAIIYYTTLFIMMILYCYLDERNVIQWLICTFVIKVCNCKWLFWSASSYHTSLIVMMVFAMMCCHILRWQTTHPRPPSGDDDWNLGQSGVVFCNFLNILPYFGPFHAIL